MSESKGPNLERPGSICIVACELAYLSKNGGIGTAHWLTALNLAARGWKVHILYRGSVSSDPHAIAAVETLKRLGIGLTLFEEAVPTEEQEARPFSASYVHIADATHEALLDLHAKHRFDLIEFSECLSMAYRSTQSKLAGRHFTDTRFLVKLHSSTHWVREANLWGAQFLIEALYDYMERYCFEHADVQCSPCRYMFRYAESNGWKVRPDSAVVPYFYPEPLGVHGDRNPGETPELVFFGRLETRKGLEVFVQAAKRLPREVKLTFLGRTNVLANGEWAVPYIAKELEGREFSVHSDFNQEQAVRYLLSGNRLAVIPSLVDNQPNTVIECIVNRIPFVAAGTGGVPEILETAGVKNPALFDPTADSLYRCLTSRLAAGPETLANTNEGFSVAGHNVRVAAEYAKFLERRCISASAPTRKPLVTVAIDCCDDPVAAAAAVRAQDYPNIEIIATSTTSKVAVAGAKTLVAADSHVGRRRREAMLAASGEYFLPISASDLLEPGAVGAMVSALERRENLAAVVGFVRNSDGAPAFNIRPVGGPRVYACLGNVFGEGPAMFRTAEFRSGRLRFDEDEHALSVQEICVEASTCEYAADVLPEYVAKRHARPLPAAPTPGRTPLARQVMANYARGGEASLTERIAFCTLMEAGWFQYGILHPGVMWWRSQAEHWESMYRKATDASAGFAVPATSESSVEPMTAAHPEPLILRMSRRGRKAVGKTLRGLNRLRKKIIRRPAA